MSNHPPSHPSSSTYHPLTHQPNHLPIHTSIPPIHSHTHLYPSTYPPIYISTHPHIHPSTHPPICLSLSHQLPSQAALVRTIFPVGHLMKYQVKKIAVEAGFSHIARQKEVCVWGRMFVYCCCLLSCCLFRVWACVSLEREISPISSVRCGKVRHYCINCHFHTTAVPGREVREVRVSLWRRTRPSQR